MFDMCAPITIEISSNEIGQIPLVKNREDHSQRLAWRHSQFC